MFGRRAMSLAAVATLALSATASSTPTFIYSGDLTCRYDAPNWRVDWDGITEVTGVNASDVEHISVSLWWEVLLGNDAGSAGEGYEENSKGYTTGVRILSGEGGEENQDPVSHAVGEFGHGAYVPSLNWEPWATVLVDSGCSSS